VTKKEKVARPAQRKGVRAHSLGAFMNLLSHN